MSEPFRFKQFEIHHNKTPHKVGTDGVLLGAWTNIDFKPNEILDIGSGSGVIALMMAQRITAETIDAVEMNADAYEECVQNFENSLWNDRLFCYHADVLELAEEPDLSYELIMSNPPFFDQQQNRLNGREQARSQMTLNYENLIKAVKKLLSPKGQFSTVLPFDKHEYFINLAQSQGLFLIAITYVRGRKDKPIKRCLMQFSFEKSLLIKNELILEISRHQYTENYKRLVRDFYLKL